MLCILLLWNICGKVLLTIKNHARNLGRLFCFFLIAGRRWVHIIWSMRMLITFKSTLMILKKRLTLYYRWGFRFLRMVDWCIYVLLDNNQLSGTIGKLALGLHWIRYDQILKASHAFNILDSRGFVGVTERARYFGRMRRCETTFPIFLMCLLSSGILGTFSFMLFSTIEKQQSSVLTSVY